jgi:hypothetical protein
MPPDHRRAARIRKDVLDIAALAWRERLPVAEAIELIDTRIDTEINEAVADALREHRPDE